MGGAPVAQLGVRQKTKYIVLHTLAFKGSAGVKEVRRWHLERGWSDIGYHYIIRRNGMIEEGRPEWASGAHAKGLNSFSVGVAFEGHGDYQPFNQKQLASWAILYNELRERYNIPPENVLGHREVPGTKKTCPGLKVDMDYMRRFTATSIKQPVPKEITRAHKITPADLPPLKRMDLVPIDPPKVPEPTMRLRRNVLGRLWWGLVHGEAMPE